MLRAYIVEYIKIITHLMSSPPHTPARASALAFGRCRPLVSRPRQPHTPRTTHNPSPARRGLSKPLAAEALPAYMGAIAK